MFKRTIEDFTCEHCGARVQGDGYTDHCPKCLWGKHVDVNPGDRACDCLGQMEPVGVEGSSPTYRIRYRCVKCGYEFRVKASPHDEKAVIVAIASKMV